MCAGSQSFYGLKFNGRSFDCGSKVGLLAASVAYALARNDMAPAARETVRQLLKFDSSKQGGSPGEPLSQADAGGSRTREDDAARRNWLGCVSQKMSRMPGNAQYLTIYLIAFLARRTYLWNR